MSSGVKVDPQCIEAYNEFKMGKKDAFIIMGFNEDLTRIVVLHREKKDKTLGDSIREKNSQWSHMIDLLPRDDVRYVIAEVNFILCDVARTDIVFVSWAPDTTSIKRRMIMASSSSGLKRTLDGIKVNVQACSYPDLEIQNVVERFKGKLD